MDLVTACFVVACAAAALYLVEAVRGRREAADPHCRRCRFGLSGHDAVPGRCPECGLALDGAGGVRRHRRVRSRAMLLAGGAAAVVLAAGAALEFGPRLAGAAWTPRALAPTALLRSQALSGAAPADALSVLAARLAAGELDDGTTRRLIDEALSRQGDSSIEWEPAWGRFVEAAAAAGKLPDDDLARSVYQAFTVGMAFEPPVGAGEVRPVLTTHAVRAGDRAFDGRGITARIAAVTIGGSAARGPEIHSWTRGGGPETVRHASDDWRFRADVPGGEHEVVVDWRLDFDPAGLAADPATTVMLGGLTPFSRLCRTEGTVTTLAEDLDAAQLFVPVDDADQLAAIIRALEAGVRIQTHTSVQPHQVMVSVDAGACPAAVDADVILLFGDEAVPLDEPLRVAGGDLADGFRLVHYFALVELDAIPPGRAWLRLEPREAHDPDHWRWLHPHARPVPLLRQPVELRDIEIRSQR